MRGEGVDGLDWKLLIMDFRLCDLRVFREGNYYFLCDTVFEEVLAGYCRRDGVVGSFVNVFSPRRSVVVCMGIEDSVIQVQINISR